MGLVAVAVRLVVVVAFALVVATLAFVPRDALASAASRERLRPVAPHLALLLAVLGANKVVRDVGPELSWMVDWNVTGLIFAVEGDFVAVVQSVATPWLTAYFSAVYLYGYAFMLVFPFLAYVALDDPTPARETALAYAANYSVGLCCYVLFVSYGPRNLLPDLVEPLLYATYPQTQLLTSEVNANTNVFPSLHTSLSVTVALMAWRTRRDYPGWLAVAAPLAASVVVATMYLGIHWATDVVAGVALAVLSVAVATRPPRFLARRRPG